jgi:hypothetical protein
MFSHAKDKKYVYWKNDDYEIGDILTLTPIVNSTVDIVQIRYFKNTRSVNMEVAIDDVQIILNADKVQTMVNNI